MSGGKRGTIIRSRGNTYRSRWEFYLAQVIELANIKFQYEPELFHLSKDVSYLPDFYIPSRDTYIECKGFLGSKDIVQLTLFAMKYRLLYVGGKEMELITGRSSLGFLSSPEIEFYIPTEGEAYRFGELLGNRSMWRKKWS